MALKQNGLRRIGTHHATDAQLPAACFGQRQHNVGSA
jgi:hypothetical protein